MEISNNCRPVRKTEEEEDNRDMDLMPRSYQIIRQYPHLSRHATFKGDNEADREAHDSSDDDNDDLDNKTSFVRHGFGRMSTVSGKSGGPGTENFNSVEEITVCGNIRRQAPAR